MPDEKEMKESAEKAKESISETLHISREDVSEFVNRSEAAMKEAFEKKLKTPDVIESYFKKHGIDDKEKRQIFAQGYLLSDIMSQVVVANMMQKMAMSMAQECARRMSELEMRLTGGGGVMYGGAAVGGATAGAATGTSAKSATADDMDYRR
ncbi:MAG: hypothetical protein ACE14P_07150 [Methanotrichaceae archaeon]